MTFDKTSSTLRAALGATALTLIASTASADIVHADDVIAQSSLCVGIDCVNGESFGFDTIRMKENNLRIKAQDTSSTGSFPGNDWQITFNDSSNGGVNKFSIDDIDGGRTPFTLIAGAPSNSLFVSAQGHLGLGTSTPVVEAHVVDGDSPTIRLEQNGSSGFTAQTWDLAGNETNFFLRDVTNGSKLPFRVRPGAPTSSIDIAAGGNVGFGDASPDAALDVRRTGTRVTMELEATTDDSRWQMIVDSDNDPNAGYSLTRVGSGTREFRLTPSGDLIITGEITTTGSCSVGCDAVFGADHTLSSIEDHAALMWENKYLPNVGPTSEEGPYNMSDKVLRMLNELEHAHIYIEQLNRRVEELEAVIADKG